VYDFYSRVILAAQRGKPDPNVTIVFTSDGAHAAMGLYGYKGGEGALHLFKSADSDWIRCSTVTGGDTSLTLAKHLAMSPNGRYLACTLSDVSTGSWHAVRLFRVTPTHKLVLCGETSLTANDECALSVTDDGEYVNVCHIGTSESVCMCTPRQSTGYGTLPYLFAGALVSAAALLFI